MERFKNKKRIKIDRVEFESIEVFRIEKKRYAPLVEVIGNPVGTYRGTSYGKMNFYTCLPAGRFYIECFIF